MTLERIFHIRGAYDLRPTEPHHANYGIHNMELHFRVKGPKGGVSCTMNTSWYQQQNQQSSYKMFSKGYPFDPCKEMMQPKMVMLDAHHKESQYEWQSPIANCDLTDGECYCDGTNLWFGEAWMEGFLSGGTDWLWPRLEQLYYHWLEDGPRPDLTPNPVIRPEDKQ